MSIYLSFVHYRCASFVNCVGVVNAFTGICSLLISPGNMDVNLDDSQGDSFLLAGMSKSSEELFLRLRQCDYRSCGICHN